MTFWEQAEVVVSALRRCRTNASWALRAFASSKILVSLTLAYTVLIFLIYLDASIGPPAPCIFDCASYVVLMGRRGWDYINTFRTLYRSYSIPVIYSLFGAYNPRSAIDIVWFQTMLSFSAWISFALSLASTGRNRLEQISTYLVVSIMMFGRGYLVFNHWMFSDSLGMSLSLIFAAAIVRFDYICRALRCDTLSHAVIALLILFAITSVAAGARDTNSLFALSCLPILFLHRPAPAMKSWRIMRLAASFVVMLCCFGSLVGSHERRMVNALNVLTWEVLPDEGMRAFFYEHGMPHSRELDAFLPFLTKRGAMASGLGDLDQIVWRQFMVARLVGAQFIGRAGAVYAVYLLTHPGYFARDCWRYRENILGQSDYFRQADSEKWAGFLSVFDLVSVDVVLAVLSGLIVIGAVYRSRDQRLFWSAATLAGAGLVNAVIAFHGDVCFLNDMQRHAFIGSVFCRVGWAVMLTSSCCRMYGKFGTQR